jgi:hypothetical protein
MRQKLFTKQIDDMLFKQYAMGNDLSKQKVVAKIFNPYGRGVWYLINSDPNDPDYIWAIVDLFEAEVGSVSREDLETIKVPPFGLNLERDIYFQPINAQELLNRVMQGERFEKGGATDLQIVKNEQQENFLTTDNPSPNQMAIKLADGGMMGRYKVGDMVYTYQNPDEKHNITYIKETESGTKYKISLRDKDGYSYSGNFIDEKSISKTSRKSDALKVKSGKMSVKDFSEKWGNEMYLKQYADGGMMGISGETDGEYVAINVDNGNGGMFEGGGMPSIGGTSFSDVDLSVSNLNTSFANGGVMDKSDLEGLIGLTFQLDLEGNGGSSEHKIEDIRVTPPSFRNRDLFIMTSDGSEDRIPMDKVADFLNNDEVVLKDSKGDRYAITLIDLFEPKVIRTQFEEEEFEYGDGGKLRNGKDRYQKGDEGMYEGSEVRVKKYLISTESYDIDILDEDGKPTSHKVVKANKFENQFAYFPKMADGGELKNIEKDAIKLSKIYGKIYLLQRQGGGHDGEYVLATEDELMDELNSKYNSRFIQLYGNGKKYADGGEIMKHKHYDYITIQLLEPTNKGWKVKQIETHNTSGKKLSKPKEKIQYFSKEEIKELFEPMMAKGGDIEVKEGDMIKSKTIKGKVYQSMGTMFKIEDEYGNKSPKFYSTRDFKKSEIIKMAHGGKIEVWATNTVDLIKQSVAIGSKKVRVEFYPAYDEKEHSNLSPKLKEALKKPKVEIFDVVEDGYSIVQLVKDPKDVKSMTWVNNKKMASGGMVKTSDVIKELQKLGYTEQHSETLVEKYRDYVKDAKSSYAVAKEIDNYESDKMDSRMANGGQVAKNYIVEYEINGVKHTSNYLLYPNDRVENLLPPIAKIISIKEKMANGGKTTFKDKLKAIKSKMAKKKR